MICIETSRFGRIQLAEDAVITVKGGLIGLPEHREFVIVKHHSETPFYWFQATTSPTLALVIMEPRLFRPDYNPPLPAGLLDELNAAAPEEISLFAIVTIPQGHPEQMTANLLGPLAINISGRTAKQLVLDDRLYSHREPIMAQG